MHEHFFVCPYCAEEISILVDPGVGEQQYVEDCEVCCRPIELQIVATEEGVETFDARTGDDV